MATFVRVCDDLFLISSITHTELSEKTILLHFGTTQQGFAYTTVARARKAYAELMLYLVGQSNTPTGGTDFDEE